MTPEQEKELLERGDRTALLLGKITGGLYCIVNLIQDGLCPQAEEEIHRLFKDTMKKIDEIYYGVKE